jgi:hypothetical protein
MQNMDTSMTQREIARREMERRIAALEAALREIAEEMRGAHDGACIPRVQAILRRVGLPSIHDVKELDRG